jgi:hypothetical protein
MVHVASIFVKIKCKYKSAIDIIYLSRIEVVEEQLSASEGYTSH